MNRRTTSVVLTILALSASVFAAGSPAPISLTPEGQKLEAYYSKMLADLEEQIKRLEPKEIGRAHV